MSENIDFYPEGCPPSDAYCHDQYVYLFARNNPPLLEDTYTAYEKGTFKKKDPCQRKSLSCGIELDYLDSIQKLFPVTNGWLRVKAEIDCKDGVLKQTNSNLYHHSLWLDVIIRKTFYTRLEVM